MTQISLTKKECNFLLGHLYDLQRFVDDQDNGIFTKILIKLEGMK